VCRRFDFLKVIRYSRYSKEGGALRKKLSSELNEIVSTWKQHIPDLGLVMHYDPTQDLIIIDYIKIPAAKRRQGYASQIIEETQMIAKGYDIPILIQPDDSFGTPVPILENLYTQNGFMKQHGNAYMRWEP
jgi:hypothetical protein